MRFLLVFLLACNGAEETDTGPVIPPGCDTDDPGGEVCSVPSQCRVNCLCSNGSSAVAERCEGQCPTNESQCELFCQAVGWSGVACRLDE